MVTVKELQEELKARGLDTKGRKAELQARLDQANEEAAAAQEGQGQQAEEVTMSAAALPLAPAVAAGRLPAAPPMGSRCSPPPLLLCRVPALLGILPVLFLCCAAC